MSEEPKKGAKLLAFWLFGTVMVVFAAITAYIMMFVPVGGVFAALKAGFPIWGITALAAILIYAVYYFYDKSKN